MSRKAHIYNISFRIVAGILAIFLYLLPALTVHAETAQTIAVDKTPRDFVLVLDCSGSMNKNDPGHLTQEAAEKFIDLLPVEHQYPTRLSIVTFGPNYGSGAYAINKNDPVSEKMVKVPFKLQTLTAGKKVEAVKSLSHELDQVGEYSPIGYALETAVDILDKNNSSDGSEHAAVILLTDGQVEGQADGFNNDMDYESIDKAVSVASSHKWPVYCMELNYEKQNRKGGGLPGIAYYQMREHIPVKTGTQPLELTDASQAEDAFKKILESMYAMVWDNHDIIVEGDTASTNLTVEDMTAEQNVTLQGENKLVEKIQTITLTSPEGQKYEFKQGDRQSSDGRVTINFANSKKYANLKMLAPMAGDWHLEVKFSDKKVANGLKIEVRSVSLLDTDLQLESDITSGEIASGTVVTFTSKYVYKGINYSSDTFYKQHPAKLIVNDEAVDMVAGSDSYVANYKFEKKGSYKVFVDVEGDRFLGGHKRSGELSYTIENEPVSADEKHPIENITIGVGKETDSIDLSKHFLNEDGDKVNYTVTYDRTVNMSHTIKGDKLSIKAATRKGSYPIEVVAKDGSGGEGAVQKFELTAENQPVELRGDTKITINLTYDDPNNKEYPVLYGDYFHDPDGISPRIAVMGDSNDNIEIREEDSHKGFTVISKGPGTVSYQITAVDASDLTESQTVTVNIVSDGGISKVIHRFGILFGLLGVLAAGGLVAVIAAFAGRKIYGVWDITPDSGAGETDREIGKTGSGKKSVCRINSLIDELGMSGEFGNARMTAGNNFNKIVYFDNLQDMSSVELDGIPVDDKKISVKAGHSIRLVYDGQGITFDRLR